MSTTIHEDAKLTFEVLASANTPSNAFLQSSLVGGDIFALKLVEPPYKRAVEGLELFRYLQRYAVLHADEEA